MSPAKFRERYAHSQIEPWGNEWEQAATIAKAAYDAAVLQVLMKFDKADKEKVAKQLERPVESFLPIPEWLRRKRNKQQRESRYLTGEEIIRSYG